jgi:hypothetical protein
MPSISVSASSSVPAPAALVYDIIADYRTGHPRILPPEYFGRLDVEAGGWGDGTRIRFEMRAFGRTNVGTARITEPVPGRELRETLDSGMVTTFLVENVGPDESRVTIRTEYARVGVRGWIEKVLVPRYLRRVYAAELALLSTEAATRTRAA